MKSIQCIPSDFNNMLIAAARPVLARTQILITPVIRSRSPAAATKKDDDSVGFLEVAWGWDKASPKKSLDDLTLNPPYTGCCPVPKSQAWSANRATLNLVEFVHWAPVVPAIIASYSVLSRAAGLAPLLPDGNVGVFLLLRC